jgi:hypothetical protein
MQIACWIPNATNIHSECVILVLIASQLREWLHERSSLLCYIYITCLVDFIRIYALFNDTVCNADYIVWAGWLAMDIKLCFTR